MDQPAPDHILERISAEWVHNQLKESMVTDLSDCRIEFEGPFVVFTKTQIVRVIRLQGSNVSEVRSHFRTSITLPQYLVDANMNDKVLNLSSNKRYNFRVNDIIEYSGVRITLPEPCYRALTAMLSADGIMYLPTKAMTYFAQAANGSCQIKPSLITKLEDQLSNETVIAHIISLWEMVPGPLVRPIIAQYSQKLLTVLDDQCSPQKQAQLHEARCITYLSMPTQIRSALHDRLRQIGVPDTFLAEAAKRTIKPPASIVRLVSEQLSDRDYTILRANENIPVVQIAAEYSAYVSRRNSP